MLIFFCNSNLAFETKKKTDNIYLIAEVSGAFVNKNIV